MVKDPFDVALAEFERWTATTQRKLSADPIGELETLLPLMRGYLDIEAPGDLSEGDLDELLLRIYPRKVAVFDPADAEPTIPAVRDFLAFLTERGEMPEGTARALERELDLIAPRFTGLVMDPSNWGMASSLMHEMAAAGVDLDDQTAVDRWIKRLQPGPDLVRGRRGRGRGRGVHRSERGLRPARRDAADAAAGGAGAGRDGPSGSHDGPAAPAGLVAWGGPRGRRG
jgi:hypothetical protein